MEEQKIGFQSLHSFLKATLFYLIFVFIDFLISPSDTISCVIGAGSVSIIITMYYLSKRENTFSTEEIAYIKQHKNAAQYIDIFLKFVLCSEIYTLNIALVCFNAEFFDTSSVISAPNILTQIVIIDSILIVFILYFILSMYFFRKRNKKTLLTAQ